MQGDAGFLPSTVFSGPFFDNTIYPIKVHGGHISDNKDLNPKGINMYQLNALVVLIEPRNLSHMLPPCEPCGQGLSI